MIQDAGGDGSPDDKEPRGLIRYLHSDLRRTVRVHLDSETEEPLLAEARTAMMNVRGISGLRVTLLPSAGPEDESEIAVLVGGRRVGRIGPHDAHAFWPHLMGKNDVTEPAEAPALLSHRDDRPLALDVGVPAEVGDDRGGG